VCVRISSYSNVLSRERYRGLESSIGSYSSGGIERRIREYVSREDRHHLENRKIVSLRFHIIPVIFLRE